MRLLLDTHIWVWSLLEPDRLAPRVVAALSNPDNGRWLSPLSVWETLILIERKRLDVDRPGEVWVREALERAPVTEVGVTHEVAMASRRLASRHRDPVDRFLVATAQVFELTLVTGDAALLAMKGVDLLPNRRQKPRRTRRP